MTLSPIGQFCARLVVALESGLAVRSRLCEVAAAGIQANRGDWDALVATRPDLAPAFKTVQMFLRMNGSSGASVNGARTRAAAWEVFRTVEGGEDNDHALRGALLSVDCDWIEPVVYTPHPRSQAATFATWDPDLQEALRTHADRILQDRPTAFPADRVDWSPSLLLAALEEWLLQALIELPTDRPQTEPPHQPWTPQQDRRLSQVATILDWLSRSPASYTNNLVNNAPRGRLTGSFTERLNTLTHFVNESRGTTFQWVVRYHETKSGGRAGVYHLESTLPADHPRSRYPRLLPCPRLRARIEEIAGVGEAILLQDEAKGRHYLEQVWFVLTRRIAPAPSLGREEALIGLALLELLAAPEPVVVQGLLWAQLLGRLQVPVASLQELINRLNTHWKTNYLLRSTKTGLQLERQSRLPEAARQCLASSPATIATVPVATAPEQAPVNPLIPLLRDMAAALDQGCTFHDFLGSFASRAVPRLIPLVLLAEERPELAAAVEPILSLFRNPKTYASRRGEILEAVADAVKTLLGALDHGSQPEETPLPFSATMLEQLRALDAQARKGTHRAGTLHNDPNFLQRSVALWMGQHGSIPADPTEAESAETDPVEAREVIAHYRELFDWLSDEPMGTSRSVLDRLRDKLNPFPAWNTDTAKGIIAEVNRETGSDFVLAYVYETHPDDATKFCEGHAVRRRGEEGSSEEAKRALVAAKVKQERLRRQAAAPPVTKDLSIVAAFDQAIPAAPLRELLLAASGKEIDLMFSNPQEFRDGLARALTTLTPFGRDWDEPERTRRLLVWAAVIELWSEPGLPVPVSEFWKTELRVRGFSAPHYRAVLAAIKDRWGTSYRLDSRSTIAITRPLPPSEALRSALAAPVVTAPVVTAPVSTAPDGTPAKGPGPLQDLAVPLQTFYRFLITGKGRAALVREAVPLLKPHVRCLNDVKLRDPGLIPAVDRLLYFISLEAKPETTYSLAGSKEAAAALLQSGLFGEATLPADGTHLDGAGMPVSEALHLQLAAVFAKTGKGRSKAATLEADPATQRSCMAYWLAEETMALHEGRGDPARQALLGEALAWTSRLPQPGAKLLQTEWIRRLDCDQPIQKIRALLAKVNADRGSNLALVYERYGKEGSTATHSNPAIRGRPPRPGRPARRVPRPLTGARPQAKPDQAAAARRASLEAARVARDKERARAKDLKEEERQRARVEQERRYQAARRRSSPPQPSNTNVSFQVGDRVKRADSYLPRTITAETSITIGGHQFAAFVITYQVDGVTRTERILKSTMAANGYTRVTA